VTVDPHFIVKPLVALAIWGLIAIFVRVIRRWRGPQSAATIVQPDLYFAVGLLCLVFAGGILWLGLADGAANGFLAWLAMCTVFGAAGVVVVVWSAIWRLSIEADGLVHRNAFGQTRMVHWREIRRLRMNRPNQALVFDLEGGGKISAPIASGKGRLLALKAEQAGVRLDGFRPNDVPSRVETPVA
jgi:hypothetical protein